MNVIQSSQNAKIKQLAKWLTQRKFRRQDKMTVLEGNHLLSSLLNSGEQPQAVFVPQNKLNDIEVRELLNRLPEHKIWMVEDAILQKISTLNQGEEIMSIYDIPNQDALPFNEDCVVLENVQDPGNVGTILRSCLASGVRYIVLSADAADVYSPKVLRAGMGAHFHLNMTVCNDLSEFLKSYKGQVLVTSLSEPNSSLYQVDLQKTTAWVVGNEGAGVSAGIQQLATRCIKIPMAGQTESLNVAMATTVCLFEQMRQRSY